MAIIARGLRDRDSLIKLGKFAKLAEQCGVTVKEAKEIFGPTYFDDVKYEEYKLSDEQARSAREVTRKTKAEFKTAVVSSADIGLGMICPVCTTSHLINRPCPNGCTDGLEPVMVKKCEYCGCRILPKDKKCDNCGGKP